MKNFLFSLLLFFSPATSISAKQIKPEYKIGFSSTYEILQKTVRDSSICVGTAIAPQALLTATHCELKEDKIKVGDRFAYITDRIRDGNDHTIYLLDFTDGSVFDASATLQQNDLTVTDEIYIIGSPGPFSRLFRKGVFSGIDQEEQEGLGLLFDIQGYPGDSGAGVFRVDNGSLVEVISAAVGEANGDERIQFMVAYPLHFSPEDLERAKTYRHVNTSNNPSTDSK